MRWCCDRSDGARQCRRPAIGPHPVQRPEHYADIENQRCQEEQDWEDEPRQKDDERCYDHGYLAVRAAREYHRIEKSVQKEIPDFH